VKKLPIGEQTFSELINPNTLYVDKTQYLYNLIRQGRGRYFFSRPRRFGKSLTCSTLSAIFSGCKELFKDLWIGQSDYEWVARPVLFFDFSQIDHRAADVLTQGLHSSLDAHAEKYSMFLRKNFLKQNLPNLFKHWVQQKVPSLLLLMSTINPLLILLMIWSRQNFRAMN
jgi:hypothetical protein